MKKLIKMISVLTAAAIAAVMLPISASAASADSSANGTFTVASLNVDGLPNKILGISLNADGPGSDGTKRLSAEINKYDWDIIAVSEDFNYHKELMSSLNGYSCGTYRGGITGLKSNTDGLDLIWKNTISASNEKIVRWKAYYGYFTNGADGMIDKGYRSYEMTIADGVTIDVYILHMDAEVDPQDKAAREIQFVQLANAIKSSNSTNPIIVMGDTNSRYTRDRVKKLFIDSINADDRFEIQDTWVENIHDGQYFNYGDPDVVALDKGGSYSYPYAEVVDKIFYINNTQSSVKLDSVSYSILDDFCDENGKALADHWPVTAKFTYTVNSGECDHSYSEIENVAPTCTVSGRTVSQCSKCGKIETKLIPPTGHNEVIDPAKPAGCVTKGLTQGSHCDTCGAVLTEQTSIPALGHDYKNGICTVCGQKDTTFRSVTTVTIKNRFGKEYSAKCGFTLARGDDGEIIVLPLSESTENALTSEVSWNIEAVGGGYRISVSIDNEVQYVTAIDGEESFSLSLGDQKDALIWSLKMDKNNGILKLTAKTSSGEKYYLTKNGLLKDQ